MTTEQIVLVKKSWKIISKIDPLILGDAFYSKLFFDHPELKPLFSSHPKEQYQKLVAMLNRVITSLDRLDEIREDIAGLAIRHRGYRVQTIHYDMVGAALLWMLESALGSDFDPATEKAWVACYTFLANAMIEASVQMS
jgi:hemoglobin-like flavoprotein